MTSTVTLQFHAADMADTQRLGRALATCLPPGTVVALDGPLGAGKTHLVQAVAEALGVDRRDVVSPTFVLIHEYRGPTPIIHIDAYRLRDEDEFLQLGADEYFRAPNLVFIEWAGRVERCLPRQRLEIAITPQAVTRRDFAITSHGEAMAHVIDCLSNWLKAGN